MPRPLRSYPQGLKPYIFHGVDFRWKDGEKQAFATCPLCDNDDDKFNVGAETGEWYCYPCQVGGGPASFLSFYWDVCYKKTQSYEPLAEHRGIDKETLAHWHVTRSDLGDWWLVPAYNSDRRLAQLYKYSGSLLLGTPIGEEKMKHCIFGLNHFDDDKPEVYLCEGPWDAMILWEWLGKAKLVDGSLKLTANYNASLLAGASVLGLPGCGVFNECWCDLFSGKVVNICFDNDHPRRHPKSGKRLPSVGFSGVQRTARILRNAKKPPAEINYLRWGDNGYTEELPSGYDVRDFLLGARL
jgi:hypothetical protein